MAGTGAQGTSLRNLARAANLLGFHARGATGPFEELAAVTGPCIAHLLLEDGSAHFAVVHRIRRNRVYLLDPARGRRRLTREAFEQLWVHRSVLLLEPTPELRCDPSVPWWSWLRGHLEGEADWLVQSCFLGTLAAGLGLATALFVQRLIDDFIPRRDTGMILATGAFLLFVLLLRSGIGYLRQRFLLSLNRRIGIKVHSEFLAHLFGLPLPFFERYSTGDLTTRQHDGIRVQGALLEVTGTSVVDGLVVLGSAVALLVLAPGIGLLALATLPLYALLLLRVVPSLRQAHGEVLSKHAEVESSLIDTLRGIRAIIGFAAAPAFAHRVAVRFRGWQEGTERLGRIQAEAVFGSEVLGGGIITLALIGGALSVAQGELRLGQFMAAYSLLAGMLPSVQRLVHAPELVEEAAVAARRRRDFLLTSGEPRGGQIPFRLLEELRLEGVSFTWDSGEEALNGVDLVLRPGTVSGLCGPNGAGKSTLLSVLQGSRLPTAGRYLIDGVPVESFSLVGLRRGIALFPAEPALFSGTLAENVLLGRRIGEGGSALARFEESGFAPFLDRFGARWWTRVGEGGRRLSTGERQVVGLLRALAGDPEVLLVDEGLAGTDEEISALLHDQVLAFGRRATVLIVSHDPRILRSADQLYRMDRGRVLIDRSFGRRTPTEGPSRLEIEDRARQPLAVRTRPSEAVDAAGGFHG